MLILLYNENNPSLCNSFSTIIIFSNDHNKERDNNSRELIAITRRLYQHNNHN